MSFNLYPYTDFHELNLDWIIRKIKELGQAFNDFEAVNKITNAGAWDITKQYQAWTIVSDNNVGYISLKPVPAGVAITNTEYWGLVADYDILITDLSARISALETRLKEFAYIPEDFGAKGDGVTDDTAAIQDAIDAAVSDGVGCVAFNAKTYKVTQAIRVDVGKISLYGNSTVINMSTSNGGLILSNSNGTPYKTANKCIYGFEFIGNSNIDCITVSAGSAAEAVSHLKIENCNIHDFRYGFVCQDHTYLIFFIGTDFYNNDTCIRLLQGTNSGENISLIGCTLYNSTTAVYNDSSNGAVNATNTSFDYNDVVLNSTRENRNYFVNCHIEGDSQIIGWAVFENSWLLLLDAVKWFDVSNNAVQRYTHCYMHTNTSYNDATVGNGKIYITECEDSNISDFATCVFNGLVHVNSNKPGIVWGAGTSDGTTPWNAPNATISKDTSEFETGTFSYKLTKTGAAGTASSMRVLIPRNPRSTHYQINFRVKTDIPATVDFRSFLTSNPGLYESNGTPKLIAENHDARNQSVVTTGDWQTVSIYGNTRYIANDDAHYFNINFAASPANNLYLDKIEVIDF